MALGLNLSSGGGEGSGNIIPILKFDARAGRLSRRDYANGEYVTVDVTRTFKAIIDLENIEVGFINFSSGGAPDFAVVKHGEKMPAAPTPEHKPGVRFLLKLSKDCGGDLREFASTAKACLRGIDDLHTAYLKDAAANAGKLPVVVLKDTIPVTTGEGARKSTNYTPVFEITGWVPRPADLVFTPKARLETQAFASNSPPATGSTQAAPPAAVSDSADDFG
jgi:hypothetical protein